MTHRRRNLTLYLDETGDSSLTKINPQFHMFGLGGVIIDDADLEIITEQIRLVKQAVFGNPDIVLHSVDLRKKRGHFKVLLEPARMRMFYSLFNDFVTTAEMSFISIFIDKQKHLKKYHKPYDPYEWSMELLLERFTHILRDADANGKIIVEARGKKEDKEIRDAFLRAMHLGTRYVDHRTLQDRVYGDLEFEPKKQNGTGLQIADMMLYPVVRALLNDDPRNPAYHVVSQKMHNRHGCNVLPDAAHPRWLTLSYSRHEEFQRLYPQTLIQKT